MHPPQCSGGQISSLEDVKKQKDAEIDKYKKYLNKAKKIIESIGEGKSKAGEDGLEVRPHPPASAAPPSHHPPLHTHTHTHQVQRLKLQLKERERASEKVEVSCIFPPCQRSVLICVCVCVCVCVCSVSTPRTDRRGRERRN